MNYMDQSTDKRVYLCSLFIDFEASKDLLHLLNEGRGLAVWCLVTLGQASYPTISHISHFRGYVDGERHGRKIEFAAYDYNSRGRVVF